jgi:hypothetical protein
MARITARCARIARVVVAESAAFLTLPYDARNGHGASANPGWKLVRRVSLACESSSFHETVGSTTTCFAASRLERHRAGHVAGRGHAEFVGTPDDGARDVGFDQRVQLHLLKAGLVVRVDHVAPLRG